MTKERQYIEDNTESLVAFSQKERKGQQTMYQYARAILPHLKNAISREQKHQIWCLLREFEGLEEVLETSLIALNELHLDNSSVLAILCFPLVQVEREDNKIQSLLSEEAKRLLKLLLRTSEIYDKGEAINSENFHKLLISMAEDIRVVLLIIANRLYRLRNAKLYYSQDEAVELANEVSSLYAPIAHKLGLYNIKGEMEDLCLKYRERKTFDFIKQKLGETKEEREAYIENFLAPLRESLDKNLPFVYKLKARVKSISSISNKLRKQNFEDIYDLFAIRIIIDTTEEKERQACWQAYSLVTDMYLPNPKRLKDWLSIPKPNGYESLHITVLGPQNKWVEVQIRTKRMDLIAEQGIAAHWRYKGIKGESGGLDDFLASVRENLEYVKNEANKDTKEILERSRLTLKAEEIYVFTPKGEVLTLPKGATVLDFAFAVHSQVGASAISAKVNGKNVSIKYQLQNGDAVSINTSPQQKPKKDWLSIVVSPKAKNRIKHLLRVEEEAGILVARETFERRIKNRKIKLDESFFIKYIARLGYKFLSEFYKDITLERLDLNNFLDQYELEQGANLLNSEQIQKETERSADSFVGGTNEQASTSKTSKAESEKGETLVIDNNLSGVEYTLAKCCMPVFGDQIFAFISSSGIKIHRISCPNTQDLIEHSPHKILSARWRGDDKANQLIALEVVGKDDISVVTHIISLIKKDSSTKLRNYKIDSNDGLFKATFTVYLEAGQSIKLLIKKIRSVAGVKNIERL